MVNIIIIYIRCLPTFTCGTRGTSWLLTRLFYDYFMTSFLRNNWLWQSRVKTCFISTLVVYALYCCSGYITFMQSVCIRLFIKSIVSFKISWNNYEEDISEDQFWLIVEVTTLNTLSVQYCQLYYLSYCHHLHQFAGVFDFTDSQFMDQLAAMYCMYRYRGITNFHTW